MLLKFAAQPPSPQHTVFVLEIPRGSCERPLTRTWLCGRHTQPRPSVLRTDGAVQVPAVEMEAVPVE